jgi:hypothetical protein
VEAALHRHHGTFSHSADEEPTSVTFHGGQWKPWDLLIGDRHGVFDLVRESTQAGAEDDPYLGPNLRVLPHHGCGAFHPVEQRRCRRHCGSEVF